MTLLPSHIVAIISLVVLPVAIAARYWKHLVGPWRRIFVLTTVAALSFNVFVLVAQLFRRIPAMIVLAPSGQGPAFAAAQLMVLALFVVLGKAAASGFKTDRSTVVG